ncbi:MAG TPA: TonB-dependent receptor [Candidatus Angelobacter sp.]|nr:TonB-dependent receptor [Candidatus Angelobacter sp.]
MTALPRTWGLATLIFFATTSLCAQVNVGELRLSVFDPAGNPVAASGSLQAATAAWQLTFSSGPDGIADVRAIPYGTYRITVHASGFQQAAAAVAIRSSLPQNLSLRLTLPVRQEEVAVTALPQQVTTDPTTRDYVVREDLTSAQPQQPGRAVLDLVASQPGWLMEANGVLHPRGSEYQTQWIIDGIPMADNRSPGYASLPDAAEFQSLTAWTAGFPAEYGRKLGGVVDAVTLRPSAGLHGEVSADGGSFGTAAVDTLLSFAFHRASFGISLDADRSDRFLDPPSPENFHNSGASTGGSAWADVDLTPKDRIRLGFSSSALSFQVPNEAFEQSAGQNQQRGTNEIAGHISYEHILSAKALAELRFSSRDLSASLSSNPQSVPIAPQQQRGFRENYASGSITGIFGKHEWKAGVDLLLTAVHENFDYAITEPAQFDPGVPASFSFRGSASGTEAAGYVQDRIALKNWTLQSGIRWDHYALLVHQNAFSPRLAALWHSESLGLSAHASYDRVFQTPAIENLLLSSSAEAQHLTSQSTGLPILPSRANYYEVGIAKTLRRHARIDLNWYTRRSTNFADDDVFLNTGVSFPIAFAGARIEGTEAKFSIPAWKRLTAQISYANMIGRAELPVTGGLLLDGGALLYARGFIPVTQDQRNTLSATARYRVRRNLWLGAAECYGSGLPFDNEITGPIDLRLLNSIDLVRQRVKPSYRTDMQIGWEVWNKEPRKLIVQAQAANVFNRFNLINFSGDFSGTAIAPPRSLGLRLRSEF